MFASIPAFLSEVFSKSHRTTSIGFIYNGAAIPNSNGDVFLPADLKYKELEVGKRYFLNRVIFETPDILKFLEENSLLPDVIVLKDNNENGLIVGDDRKIGIPDYVLDALRFRR